MSKSPKKPLDPAPLQAALDEEIKEAIRLALEAAEAANDSAAEAAHLRAQAEGATRALGDFAAKIRPVILGAAIGAGLTVVLGGLIYFRALGDLRDTTATNLEALALFAERVETLDARSAELAALTESLGAIGGAIEGQTATLGEAVAQAQSALAEAIAQSQSALSAQITAEAQAIQAAQSEALIAGLSDLQLALSRMLADGLPNAAAPSSATARAPAPAPSAPAPAPAARRAAASPNPFSVP